MTCAKNQLRQSVLSTTKGNKSAAHVSTRNSRNAATDVMKSSAKAAFHVAGCSSIAIASRVRVATRQSLIRRSNRRTGNDIARRAIRNYTRKRVPVAVIILSMVNFIRSNLTIGTKTVSSVSIVERFCNNKHLSRKMAN